MVSERNINYLNKDFSKFRSQLIEFAKNYFPDTYADFSATSPGMMFMEMAAYVGDVLSFYQDSQVQETYLQYAKNPVNIYAMAYMMGYRPKVTTVSETEITFTQEVAALPKYTSRGEIYYEPDWNSLYRIGEHSQFKSNTSPEVSFILKEPVDMWYSSSNSPTTVEVATWEGDNPKTYKVSKVGRAFSGEIRETTFTFENFKKYQTVSISDKNIVGILDVVDSDNNYWTEVPFLGQDTIFKNGTQPQEEGTQYILELEKVPRRFTSRFTSKGKLQIQFGAGMYADDQEESDFLPNPNTLADDPQTDLVNKGDVSYDPSNFLFTKSYGLVPTNTTLTVRYIVGGGVKSNVPANSIVNIGKEGIKVSRRNSQYSLDEYSGLEFINKVAATGGRDGDTLEEVRQNSLRSFAEQKRAVTLQDYNIRALSMPARYGSVYKVFATNDLMMGVDRNQGYNNPLAVSLYVLSKDITGKLTYTKPIAKENLKKYLSNYMMLTDAVDIKDAYIVNIGVRYDVILRPDFYSMDVLGRCNSVIKDFFSLDKRAINETINLSDLYVQLDSVRGVQTVRNIEIINKVGENYSKYAYDTKAATLDRVVYPSYDPCIFELRYPDEDIEGRVVKL